MKWLIVATAGILAGCGLDSSDPGRLAGKWNKVDSPREQIVFRYGEMDRFGKTYKVKYKEEDANIFYVASTQEGAQVPAMYVLRTSVELDSLDGKHYRRETE